MQNRYIIANKKDLTMLKEGKKIGAHKGGNTGFLVVL